MNKIGVALLLVLSLARSATAQSSAEAQADSILAGLSGGGQTPINGFASFNWGATSASIVRKLGAPQFRKSVSDGEWLMYEDRVLGYKVTAVYQVHAKRGLLLGSYHIDFGMGDDCERAFTTFREALFGKYRAIKPVESKTQKNNYLTFCQEIQLGDAEWTVRWDDDKSPKKAMIVLALSPEAKSILATYGNEDGVEWLQSQRSAETREKL